MKKFNAPWGKALIFISSITTLVLLFIVVIGLTRSEGGGTRILILLPLLILLGALPFIIKGYSLEGDQLLIHRSFWTDRINLQDLENAGYQPNGMARSLRIGGNGGLYSFTGWYWNRKHGRYRAYVTDLNHIVVLTFQNRTIMLSPDRPEEFVEAIRGVA